MRARALCLLIGRCMQEGAAINFTTKARERIALGQRLRLPAGCILRVSNRLEQVTKIMRFDMSRHWVGAAGERPENRGRKLGQGPGLHSRRVFELDYGAAILSSRRTPSDGRIRPSGPVEPRGRLVGCS